MCGPRLGGLGGASFGTVSKGILTSIRHKQSLYKSFYIQGNIEQKTFYKKYASKLTKIKQIAKTLYYENKFRDTADNSRQLWNLLNDILPSKKSSSAPNVLNVSGLEINNTADITNHLNSFSCKVGQTLADQIICDPNDKNSVYYPGKRVSESIFITSTYPQEVQRITTTLHNSQSTGPDGISSSFIKLASNQLSLPLTILFNFCVENGIFPDSLKISKVIPIYKSGPKENMSNYRPISLLPVLSKVFEKFIYSRIFSFIKKHNILSSTQYGFRPNISPELAVVDVV